MITPIAFLSKMYDVTDASMRNDDFAAGYRHHRRVGQALRFQTVFYAGKRFRAGSQNNFPCLSP